MSLIRWDWLVTRHVRGWGEGRGLFGVRGVNRALAKVISGANLEPFSGVLREQGCEGWLNIS